MAVETGTFQVVMPAMGDSVTEGTILEWHKQEGDHIDVDETIVEISTDKVDAEVPAPVAPAPQQEWPDQLVERPMRTGFPVPLPLNADGSAPEHAASEAGTISEPLMWKTTDRQAPQIDFDYKNMKIKVDTRGLGKLGGTLHFSDLDKLPHVSHTFLLQCGVTNPHGVVKWTGVRLKTEARSHDCVRHARWAWPRVTDETRRGASRVAFPD